MTKKIIVMAGGTGGHVFPAIAVAHHLIKNGWQVRWLGTADRMEAQLVPENGIEIDFIKITGLRGKRLITLVSAPFKILNAIFQARKIMKTFQPDVVLGMGGYVSGPGGVAAKTLGIPIILHEQNGVAGLTNRWLSKIATQVLQAFPSAFPNAQVVGNPVRTALLNIDEPDIRFEKREGPIRILAMGGSQGASIINQVIPQVIKALENKFCVYHQTGKGKLNDVSQIYQGCDMTNNKIVEFIDDVAQAYSWADIVICRSGALTVSEIEAIGVSAIFVPFMHKDRQQYYNAKALMDIGAAWIIEQPEFNPNHLLSVLLTVDRKLLCQKAKLAKSLAIKNSTEKVAQAIEDAIK